MKASASIEVSSADEAASRQFLVFSLGDGEYAIDILKVQEIRAYENVTRVANAPPYVKGLANLRGLIVPIVDLRVKFSLGAVTYDSSTVVIVVNIRDRVVGIVVDKVSDVVTLTATQIKPTPELGGGLPLDYVQGLGDLDNRMLILMDVERLLTSAEMGLVGEAANQDAA